MQNSHNGSIVEKNWYDKHYKTMLILPAILFLAIIFYIFVFYQHNGDFMHKDVSLTGGTSVTVFDKNVDGKAIAESLKIIFPDMQYRIISDFRNGEQHGFSIETKADSKEIIKALEAKLGYTLDEKNSSIEFSGAGLSTGFYSQLTGALIVAFLFMAWVVFLTFSESWKMKGFASILTFLVAPVILGELGWLKALSVIVIITGAFIVILNKHSTKRDKIIGAVLGLVSAMLIYLYPNIIIAWIVSVLLIIMYVINSIPSFAVIFSASADILMTLAVVDILGIHVSSAGIVAFLMLIGYSVDTDILLTSRLLRDKEGSVNHRLFGAFKTGMTMTLTAIAAVGVSFAIVYSFSETLKQIFGIILIGLVFDMMNTWITNASILKWFMEVKKLQ